MHLILWDVDGTLIDGDGLTDTILQTALQHTYGPPSKPFSSFAGKTDQQIILEAYAEQSAHTLPATLDHFTNVYLDELRRCQRDLLARGCVLAGARAILERFAEGSVVQSVLTGNLMPIAHYKLHLFGLARYLDLRIGAYGSDHHQRTALVPIALTRAAHHYGREYALGDVTLIGDTPNDVACGRAAGVRTIAVATGAWTQAKLQACGADVVLPNLEDTSTVLNTIAAGFEFEY